ncbi:MAG: nitrous oxide reductase family maturation protein NosD [Bacteroidota bacterium]|nr:nitrous oxide reductase family maturation protein NosD [Bacteroidota bacterium]
MKRTLIILFLICTNFAFASTIVVGKNQVITSLRQAIKIANDDDTILLQNGIYKEGNIIINKSIKLIGVDEPILDGENKYEILTVSGTRIIIKGIHFKNSGYSSMNDYASIDLVDAQYVIIENNIIEHAYFAIHVANSKYCLIANNIITGTPKTEQTSGNAIHLWKCDSMVVEENNVQGHRDGIYFEFVTNSYILGNVSHNNIRYGLHFMFSNNDSYMKNSFIENGAGVAVMYSHHVLMHSNTFQLNWGPNAYGILLKEISDASIINNNFDQNTVGILMESTNRIEVELNNFKNNGWALRIQASCNENTVHHNNFSANTFDVATNGTMMLNKFYNNYWDKYDGYDMNKDGFGDIAYHPVSMYSMVIEQNPNSLLLLRSFMVSLLDKAEKAIPGITPENLIDVQPLMRRMNYDQN